MTKENRETEIGDSEKPCHIAKVFLQGLPKYLQERRKKAMMDAVWACSRNRYAF